MNNHQLIKMRTATVAHHKTCHYCGRKLVNLYYKAGDWRCRSCWEEQAAKKGDKHETD